MMNDSASADSLSWPAPGARPINCDQVAWMLAAIGRYLPHPKHPAVSRERQMMMFGLLYEIMESANLYFVDEGAQHNGTPPDVRRFCFASKRSEAFTNVNRNTKEQ